MSKNTLPLTLGDVFYAVQGGPYRAKPANTFGVKLAVEIHANYAIQLPIPDFSTPSYEDTLRGLIVTSAAIVAGESVYAGCMGGRGRTGLFLSLLAKTFHEAELYLAAYNEEAHQDRLISGSFFRRMFRSSKPFTSRVVDRYRALTSLDEFDPVIYTRQEYSQHAVETNDQYKFVTNFDVLPIVQALIPTYLACTSEPQPMGV